MVNLSKVIAVLKQYEEAASHDLQQALINDPKNFTLHRGLLDDTHAWRYAIGELNGEDKPTGAESGAEPPKDVPVNLGSLADAIGVEQTHEPAEGAKPAPSGAFGSLFRSNAASTDTEV